MESKELTLDELLADLDNWASYGRKDADKEIKEVYYNCFTDIINRYFSDYDDEDIQNFEYQEIIADYDDCVDYAELSKEIHNYFEKSNGFEIFQFSTEYITAISRGIIISNDILEIEYSITTIERY